MQLKLSQIYGMCRLLFRLLNLLSKKTRRISMMVVAPMCPLPVHRVVVIAINPLTVLLRHRLIAEVGIAVVANKLCAILWRHCACVLIVNKACIAKRLCNKALSRSENTVYVVPVGHCFVS